MQWADDPGISKRKLGLLAGVFEDGSLSIFAVPDPVDLPASEDGPVFGMLLVPTARLEGFS